MEARTTLKRAPLAGLVIAGLTLSACGNSANSGSGDSGLETTEISIGLGLDPGLAPQMVAIEKGFLEEEGFTDINTSMYEAGALSGEALAAGEIDVWGPSNLPPINMRHNGAPVVVVGTAASGWSEKLVVRDDATLNTVEDLKNIKIGSLSGATSNIVSNLADAVGLEVEDFQTVNLTPPEQMVALANNEVQAILTWNPWPAQFQVQYPDVPVTYYWEQNTSFFPWAEDEPMKASNSRMLFLLREDFIRDNPNTSEAVMRALYRAQDWLSDDANRDEAIQIFSKYTEYDTELVDAIWDDYTFQPDIDEGYVNDMQSYTDFLASIDAIESPQDPLTYTYTEFLTSYAPDKVEVEGTWQP